VNDSQIYAEQFERHRAQMQAVAYRMLGSMAEAEDAVQEAWLRLSRSDAEAVNNLGGWLTAVVGRICIDMLRARRRRNEDYVGTWLPEPVVNFDESTGPERQVELAESVGLALLVVLETLGPAERLAFVLHDMFGVPFEEIASIVERTPAATRQLASRARRRVHGAPEPDGDLVAQRRVVEAFLAASQGGDFEALMEVLDPEVSFKIDAGKGSPFARPPIVGAENVAREVLARGRPFAPFGRPAIVNGSVGVVVGRPERPFAIAGCTISGGRIVELDLVIDPDKLAAVTAPGSGPFEP
jgi:RNA polymerase sigma-70 factor (ECF subfamily)